MTAKEKARDRHLIKKYNINLKMYNMILEMQNHCCAICGKHKSMFKKSLAVDHSRKNLEVRGLLCYWCNNKLVGRHNPETVKKLVAYLLPEYELVKR